MRSNLLSAAPRASSLPLGFETETFDFEAGDVRAIGTRHALSYGGNFRHNTFDMSLAPDGEDRNEGGAYIQDEIFFSDHFRWVVGGRLDKFSSIEDAVFSPRTTLHVEARRARTQFGCRSTAPSGRRRSSTTTWLRWF